MLVALCYSRTSPEEESRVYRDKKPPPLVPCWHASDGFISGGIKPGCDPGGVKRPQIRKTYVYGSSVNTFLGILSGRDDLALRSDFGLASFSCALQGGGARVCPWRCSGFGLTQVRRLEEDM